MTFASVYVPDFWIQAAIRAESTRLQGAIALIDGRPPLERVVAINAAAANAGIELGMSKSQAAQFPSVEIQPRSLSGEQSAHAALLDIGWSISPRVEDTATDAMVIDLAGLDSLFGPQEAIARLLARRASDFGLLVHVAVSSNLEVALHAARGFPGITVVPPGEESQRLGALPVEIFSPPVEMIETLERWGVRTCGALARLPVLELSERLGQDGIRLHRWARGASRRSFIPAEPKLYFEEELALEDAVEELEPLAFLLGRLLQQLCARLAARSLSACAIRLRFELDASSEKEPAHRIAVKRSPENKFYEKLFTLPVPPRDSKTLLTLLRLHLQSDPPASPIKHIFLAADSASPRALQRGLFLPAAPDPEKLELTVARLANLVGDSRIGTPCILDSHRQDTFQMGRFLPSQGEPEISDALGTRTHRVPLVAFRAFRPAPRAQVALREGRPAHISFSHMHGEVTVASGPWRTSGEWWRDDGWNGDEWDVEVHPPSTAGVDALEPQSLARPSGIYRIYYDALSRAWFVAGMYD